MKKLLAILFLLTFLALPLFALGAVEGGAGGAAAGAVIGSIFPVIGTVVGAVIGGIVGAVGGGVKQYNEEEVKATQYDANVTAITQENRKIKNQNDTYEKALQAWEGNYLAETGSAIDNYQQNIKALKDNWSTTNAVLGSQERSGLTAKFLSEEAKNRVITYAGEDMELNSSEMEAIVNGAFENQDASALNVTSSKYGIYDYAFKDLITSSRQQKQSIEQTMQLNDDAIKVNNENIKRNEKLKENLFFF